MVGFSLVIDVCIGRLWHNRRSSEVGIFMRLAGGWVDRKRERWRQLILILMRAHQCTDGTGILQSAKSVVVVGVGGGFLALSSHIIHTTLTLSPSQMQRSLVISRLQSLDEVAYYFILYYTILHYAWHTKDKNRHSPYLVLMLYTLVENMVLAWQAKWSAWGFRFGDYAK